jgi:hypothetical protein
MQVDFETGKYKDFLSLDPSSVGQVGEPSRPYINTAFSGEKVVMNDTLNWYKKAVVINFGYPLKNEYHTAKIGVEKSVNIAFLEIGFENSFKPQLYYSIDLSSYNHYYIKSFTGAVPAIYGKAIKTRIEPAINIWRKLSFLQDKSLELGLGAVGRFEYDISLENIESKYASRISYWGKDAGFQLSAKYYLTLKTENQVGVLARGKWFLKDNTFDIGLGLSYRHLIIR